MSASDLVRATGCSADEANQQVRQVARRGEREDGSSRREDRSGRWAVSCRSAMVPVASARTTHRS
ncbi:hypothetical protein DRA43_00245 [Micromonospora provocatoris]|nr:hypothetical protein DRA43_00245 [Micromonospora provocatoris]